MAERRAGRAVAALVAAALGAGALVALDRGLGASVHTPGQLYTRLQALELAPDARHVAILGTCLSEQHILLPRLEAALPAGWAVHNLGAASTTPIEWYLAWKNHLPHDRVDVLLIGYGRFDLTEPTTPWESETLDLVGPGDMDELVAASCTTVECGLDLRLQRASALWRYRPILGAIAWHRLGLAPPEDTRLTRLRVVEGKRSSSAEVWDPENPSVVYLERLLTEARAQGTTVMLMPLPLRPDPLDPHQEQVVARLEAAVADLAARTGAVQLPVPPLPREVFADEVHLGPEGSIAYTDWLGGELPGRLP